MNAGNRNTRAQQRASALKTWSQIVGVACVFLIILPRCTGCRSPIDPILEKIYGVELEADGSIKPDIEGFRSKN